MSIRWATALIALAAAPSIALAGGMAQPDVVTVPAAAPEAPSDWTGFYVGLQYSQANESFDTGGFDSNWEPEGPGFHAGYMYDFGDFVGAVELTHDHFDYSADGFPDDTTTHTGLHGKVGYDLGAVLPFVGLGVVHGETSGIFDGSFNGFAVSAGLTGMVTENISLTGQYTRLDYGDANGVYGPSGSGVSNTYDVATIRIGLHF